MLEAGRWRWEVEADMLEAGRWRWEVEADMLEAGRGRWEVEAVGAWSWRAYLNGP